jgi:hypothetical protein
MEQTEKTDCVVGVGRKENATGRPLYLSAPDKRDGIQDGKMGWLRLG